MELHLEFTGFLLVILGLVHFAFPRYFRWRTDLNGLVLINRQMMYVHTFFIAVVLLLMGTLCITSSSELIQSNLGRKLSLGLGIFWSLRLLIQLFGYSSQLWKGKTFETVIHVLFLLLWTYLSSLFLMVYFGRHATGI